jgi:hypothetical protein
MAYEEPRNGTTITSTLKLIVDDVRELFREEVALARAEIRHEFSAYTRAAAVLAFGALTGGAALLLVRTRWTGRCGAGIWEWASCSVWRRWPRC